MSCDFYSGSLNTLLTSGGWEGWLVIMTNMSYDREELFTGFNIQHL